MGRQYAKDWRALAAAEETVRKALQTGNVRKIELARYAYIQADCRCSQSLSAFERENRSSI